MFEDLKKSEPKTYIIISLAFIMVVIVVIGLALYLTAITRYLELGVHIISAIVGIIFCFLGILMVINIMGHVSKLRTKMDIEEQEKRAEAKLKWQLQNKRMEIILEKLKRGENLTLAEGKELGEIEEIELGNKQGDSS